jgi:hypothetical protein
MNDHDHPDDQTRPPSLDAHLAALPRELPPARDLWAGIDARLTRTERGPRRWPLALAAGIVLAALGAVVGARLAPPAGPAPTVAAVPPAASGLVPARLKGTEDAEYLATRAALEKTYRERIALLAPGTRARIEQDLALIRSAHEDIQQALARDPGSRVLLQLLQSTTEQEFSLYSTVGRNTEPFASRTST